jgi:DNA-binding response OmpR family regulator
VRTDVLAEYLARYRTMFKNARHETPPTVLKSFLFAGASVDPVERTLCHRKKVSHLTPHEVDLAELLIQSEGGIVTYDTLYSSILDRRFRGDTSNMRVLLGKLAASARRSGVQLRQWVKVIPKMGYRYQSPVPEEVVSPKPRRLVRSSSR